MVSEPQVSMLFLTSINIGTLMKIVLLFLQNNLTDEIDSSRDSDKELGVSPEFGSEQLPHCLQPLPAFPIFGVRQDFWSVRVRHHALH